MFVIQSEAMILVARFIRLNGCLFALVSYSFIKSSLLIYCIGFVLLGYRSTS